MAVTKATPAKEIKLPMSWFRQIIVWSIMYVIVINKLLRGSLHWVLIFNCIHPFVLGRGGSVSTRDINQKRALLRNKTGWTRVKVNVSPPPPSPTGLQGCL